ncbi:MAG: hypothetical protein PHY29_03075 [Syntrophales bacterium]|nr:hypothetical protein [Syntrophales bacterium]
MANSLAAWRNYFNQRYLTTGMKPSPEELQALRMAELNEEYNRKAQSRSLALQEQALAQQASQNTASNALTQQSITNQLNLGTQSLEQQYAANMANIRQAEKQAQAQKQAGLISAGVQAPLAGLAVYKLGKELDLWGNAAAATNPFTTIPTTGMYEGIGAATQAGLATTPYTTIPTTGMYEGIGAATQAGLATTPYTTIPTTGMYEGIGAATELGDIYGSTAAANLAAGGETTGTLAGTATGIGSTVAAGSLVPEAGAGYYSGIGAATQTGLGAGSSGISGAMSAAAPYAAPVGAGSVGGMIGSAVGQWMGDQVGFGGSNEWGAAGGIAGGAAAGAAIGSIVPGVGNVVGGVIGGIVGGAQEIFDDCIICTACHGRDSAEVDVTRRFRDRFMDEESIRGYYMLAEPVVMNMKRDLGFSWQIKRDLVDRLIDYGRFKLGETELCAPESEQVSLEFLAACKRLGSTVDSYIRANGERV